MTIMDMKPIRPFRVQSNWEPRQHTQPNQTAQTCGNWVRRLADTSEERREQNGGELSAAHATGNRAYRVSEGRDEW
ncbi:MAG: hypothetical protein H7839_06045 [Magnetococcus sp. YQC-5]